MVFKVKQKSQAIYEDIVVKQVDQSIKPPQLIGPQRQSADTQGYSVRFNWPYDYVSIIEMVKVEADILYKGDVLPPPEISGPELNTPSQGAVAPGSTTGRINDILDKAKRRARYANPTAKRADSKPVTAADSGPGPDFDLDRTE
jgi:hypothetical protein